MHGIRLRVFLLAGALFLVPALTGVTWAAEQQHQAQPPVANQATKYTTGDIRCMYGPGVQVWQDANFTGPSMILCGFHAQYTNIGSRQDNLDYLANWNDRISSFQVFNSNRLSLKWYLCLDASFGGGCESNLVDGSYSHMNSGYNDGTTSIGD
jgi:hypothetical protein